MPLKNATPVTKIAGGSMVLLRACYHCAFDWLEYPTGERPHNHKPAPEPWEPKVGDRVVHVGAPGIPANTAGVVVERDDVASCYVCWIPDDEKAQPYHDNRWSSLHSQLRPETREDREARAREIFALAKAGDRFRVIERPVDKDGNEHENHKAGKVVTCQQGVRHGYLLTGYGWCVEAWNLVPLPAEPEKQRWRKQEGYEHFQYIGMREIDSGDLLCGNWLVNRFDEVRPALESDIGKGQHLIVRPLPPDDEVEAMRTLVQVLRDCGYHKRSLIKPHYQRVLDTREARK
jgi:hypothetical protein